MSATPRLLLVIDGMADRPLSELKNRTPLQAAHLPVMDSLASEGQCGVADPLQPGAIATTVSGTLAILGYDPLKHSIGRGVIEALGCGVDVLPGDVAFRGNWATLDRQGKIIDRRAGRIREGTQELAAAISGMKIGPDNFVDVGSGTEHRLAVVLRGGGLQACVSGSDPGDHYPSGIKPLRAGPLDKENGFCRRTADLLNQFELKAKQILTNHPLNQSREAKGLLSANAILTREPGQIRSFPKIKHPCGSALSGICIAGEDTISGIARIAGMEVCQTPAMTANLDTDLNEKFRLTGEWLEKREPVILHIKGCDIAAHNREAEKKRDFLEKIDCELGQFLAGRSGKLRLAITADHSTWSKDGVHVEDPVPVLLHGDGVLADLVSGFDEFQAQAGLLGRFRMCELWKMLFA